MAGGPTMHFNNVFSRQIRHMLQTLAEGSSCRSLVEFSSAFSRSLVEFSSKYAGLPSGERLQAFCCDIFVVLWFQELQSCVLIFFVLFYSRRRQGQAIPRGILRRWRRRKNIQIWRTTGEWKLYECLKVNCR